MSGGYFDYNQFRINDIIDELQTLKANGCLYPGAEPFDATTLSLINETILQCNMAFNMVHSLDYYISGDTDLETCINTIIENNDNNC